MSIHIHVFTKAAKGENRKGKSLNVSFIRFGSWFYMLLCTILCSSQLGAKGDPSVYVVYIFKAVEGSNIENYCHDSYPSVFFRETTSL